MENKDRYFKGLIENDGQLNEIDLGEKLRLYEEETREIIVLFLLQVHFTTYLILGKATRKK